MRMRTMAHPHRRMLLLSAAALIIFSTSPIFGHHVATRADALLLGVDHLGSICLIALHMLLAPVHAVFHWLLYAGIVYATWNRVRAWQGLRHTIGELEATPPAPKDLITLAARRAGLAPDRLLVVEGLPNPAFTAGFWRPKVYVSASLSNALDVPQLEAVLAHEAAHVARRDPLRLSLMRFLACAIFYVPALRRLADDLTDEAEIDADDAAMAHSEPLVLASAILALAEWRIPGNDARAVYPLRPGSVVAFQPSLPFKQVDLLERRVRRLAGERTPTGTHLTRRSLGGACATLLAIWVSGLVVAHPLPASEMGAVTAEHAHVPASHCRHRGAFAVTHLFCLGLLTHSSGTPCPHTGR